MIRDEPLDRERGADYAPVNRSRGGILISIVFAILLVVAGVLWTALASGSVSLHGSDPAGNALSRSFTALAGIALWIVLGVSLVIAGIAGDMPPWSRATALLLVPASGVAVQLALRLMGENRLLRWPAVLPAAIPLLLLAYASWCYFPWLRARIDPVAAGAIVWGTIAVLTPLPWLVQRTRERAAAAIPPRTPEQIAEQQARTAEAQRAQRRDRFQALSPDSSLQEWWDFTEDGSEFRQQARDGAKHARSRQQDAVKMVAGGKRSLFLALPELDLTATPELSQAVRDFLADQVKYLRPYDPAQPMATSVVTEWFAPYLPTIRWLVAHQGDCDAELAAIEAAVCRYPDSPERQAFVESLHTVRKTR